MSTKEATKMAARFAREAMLRNIDTMKAAGATTADILTALAEAGVMAVEATPGLLELVHSAVHRTSLERLIQSADDLHGSMVGQMWPPPHLNSEP